MGEDVKNRQRFDSLLESYGPDVVAYCTWRAGSATDAQDAAAEVFLTACEAADPSALLSAVLTIGADGILRELAVSWGSGPSVW